MGASLKKQYPRLKHLLYLEGAMSFAHATILSGVFMIGFGILLGASNLQIGLLVAIPLFANLLQLISAYILEKARSKKNAALIGVGIGRLLLIFFPLSALGYELLSGQVNTLLIVLLISSLFASSGSLALLSWMKDIVPVGTLSRFFSHRNIYSSIAGIAAYIIGSYVIDIFFGLRAYGILFLIAWIIGLLGAAMLMFVPEQKKKIRAIDPRIFIRRLKMPFQDNRMKPLLSFAVLWGFSANLAAPFFIVYMMKDLALSLFMISLFLIVDTIFRILGLNFWGEFVDRHGARPALAIGATVSAMVPLAFIFINITNFWLIPAIFSVSAFAYAAIDAGFSRIMFTSAKRQYDAYYLASFSSLIGFFLGLGAITGGFLSDIIPLTPIPDLLSPLQWVFVLSFLLRVLSLPLIHSIHEHKARNVDDLLKQMRSIRFVSFFVPVYSIAHYTSKLVLIPSKQFFILQRKTTYRMRRDILSLVASMTRASITLSSVTANTVSFSAERVHELTKSIVCKLRKIRYLRGTNYFSLPFHYTRMLVSFDKLILKAPKEVTESQILKLRRITDRISRRLFDRYEAEIGMIDRQEDVPWNEHAVNEETSRKGK